MLDLDLATSLQKAFVCGDALIAPLVSFHFKVVSCISTLLNHNMLLPIDSIDRMYSEQ